MEGREGDGEEAHQHVPHSKVHDEDVSRALQLANIKFISDNHTGLGLKVVPRLCECCRQSQAEVVSKSSNKIHQTWGPPFNQALYLLYIFKCVTL